MIGPLPRPRGLSRQHGQTLAEFAISLPLVLILLFGILEFGRMFQSWVTLQNAARSAVRYAVTGQYNQEKYDLEFLVPCYQKDQQMDIINVPVSRYNPSTKTAETFFVQGFTPKD
jgi:Flp pilus assembly protein TadG